MAGDDVEVVLSAAEMDELAALARLESMLGEREGDEKEFAAKFTQKDSLLFDLIRAIMAFKECVTDDGGIHNYVTNSVLSGVATRIRDAADCSFNFPASVLEGTSISSLGVQEMGTRRERTESIVPPSTNKHPTGLMALEHFISGSCPKRFHTGRTARESDFAKFDKSSRRNPHEKKTWMVCTTTNEEFDDASYRAAMSSPILVWKSGEACNIEFMKFLKDFKKPGESGSDQTTYMNKFQNPALREVCASSGAELSGYLTSIFGIIFHAVANRGMMALQYDLDKLQATADAQGNRLKMKAEPELAAMPVDDSAQALVTTQVKVDCTDIMEIEYPTGVSGDGDFAGDRDHALKPRHDTQTAASGREKPDGAENDTAGSTAPGQGTSRSGAADNIRKELQAVQEVTRRLEAAVADMKDTVDISDYIRLDRDRLSNECHELRTIIEQSTTELHDKQASTQMKAMIASVEKLDLSCFDMEKSVHCYEPFDMGILDKDGALAHNLKLLGGGSYGKVVAMEHLAVKVGVRNVTNSEEIPVIQPLAQGDADFIEMRHEKAIANIMSSRAVGPAALPGILHATSLDRPIGSVAPRALGSLLDLFSHSAEARRSTAKITAAAILAVQATARFEMKGNAHPMHGFVTMHTKVQDELAPGSPSTAPAKTYELHKTLIKNPSAAIRRWGRLSRSRNTDLCTTQLNDWITTASYNFDFGDIDSLSVAIAMGLRRRSSGESSVEDDHELTRCRLVLREAHISALDQIYQVVESVESLAVLGILQCDQKPENTIFAAGQPICVEDQLQQLIDDGIKCRPGRILPFKYTVRPPRMICGSPRRSAIDIFQCDFGKMQPLHQEQDYANPNNNTFHGIRELSQKQIDALMKLKHEAVRPSPQGCPPEQAFALSGRKSWIPSVQSAVGSIGLIAEEIAYSNLGKTNVAPITNQWSDTQRAQPKEVATILTGYFSLDTTKTGATRDRMPSMRMSEYNDEVQKEVKKHAHHPDRMATTTVTSRTCEYMKQIRFQDGVSIYGHPVSIIDETSVMRDRFYTGEWPALTDVRDGMRKSAFYVLSEQARNHGLVVEDLTTFAKEARNEARRARDNKYKFVKFRNRPDHVDSNILSGTATVSPFALIEFILAMRLTPTMLDEVAAEIEDFIRGLLNVPLILPGILDLISKCQLEKQADRPNFAEIKSTLEELYNLARRI